MKNLLFVVWLSAFSMTALAQRGGAHGAGGGGGPHGGGGGGGYHSAPARPSGGGYRPAPSGGGYRPSPSYPAQQRPSAPSRPAQNRPPAQNRQPIQNHQPIQHQPAQNRGPVQAGHNNNNNRFPSGGAHSYSNVGHGSYRGSSTISHNGRTYVQRTYVNNRNVTVNRIYGAHYWGVGYGHPYYGYHSGWGVWNATLWGLYVSPWAWGSWYWPWLGAPWYTNYWSWYYRPYPTYVSVNQYVSDQVMSNMLADAYQRGLDEGRQVSPTPTNAPITDYDRTQITGQVDGVATAFKAEQSMDFKVALKDPKYIFPVNQTLSFSTGNGGSCTLTEGDLLTVFSQPSETQQSVSMIVHSAKFAKDGCAAGTKIDVSINDLQEMLNSFAERVDDSLQSLQKNNGPTQQRL